MSEELCGTTEFYLLFVDVCVGLFTWGTPSVIVV